MSNSDSTPIKNSSKRIYQGPVTQLLSRDAISADFLRANFYYCSETGVFTKKPWIGSRGRVSKEVVYGASGTNKYIQIPIGGKMFFAHRLAFVYMLGIYPSLQVDHIDGNGRNNMFSNLRLVTHKENAQHNVNGNSNNTTGLRGAYKSRDKWVSSIGVNGIQKHIGVFETKEMAHNAYLNEKSKVHFQ